MCGRVPLFATLCHSLPGKTPTIRASPTECSQRISVDQSQHQASLNSQHQRVNTSHWTTVTERLHPGFW
ncbi:hypothetical protein PCANC_00102 [Puccinia coronata f. sp. avenae]|uniref:Uncharacterized protein n=1 Tax=Puccinia coronata f. sp. avenae TaxID=200324 RepID=A0A2N5S765_9BASI|nr:hypothetical protein PCANC_25997 [Puccinia coronata f. sp. avenae]PLW58583.1 hypothetical protein PCANC_00102 [Puccinia coronata f. sp. avenae]